MGTEMAFRFKGLYVFSTFASAEWECVEILVSFRKINLKDVLVFMGSCKCLPYVAGFGFKQKILSCDKENLCDSSKTTAPISSNKLFHLAPQKNFTKCLNNYLTAPN